MKRIPLWAWAAPIVLVIAIGLYLSLHRKAVAEDSSDEAQATASVTLAAVRAETLDTVVRAYGVIQPAADANITVSAAKAAVVTRLMVGLGQEVRAGQVLLELANAPATQQAYRQAADAVAFAETDLGRLQRMAAEHLATNDQVSTAQKTLADARAALAAQQAEGAGHAVQSMLAPAAGVVTAVTAKPGDRIAQDAVLLTLARSGRLVASLNVQPGAAGSLRPGDAVQVVSSFGGPPLSLRLSTVGRLSDPTSRAIQVVAPVPAAAFPVGEAVQADIIAGSHQGLVVPRTAVVFDETGAHLFTVMGGKAHRVFVKPGAEHGAELEVTGQISAGVLVAVQGAYELQDGMNIRASGG